MGFLRVSIIALLALAAVISCVHSRTTALVDINRPEELLPGSQKSLRRTKKQIDSSDDKYSDAAYAGKLAFMLKNLESENKEVYANFISSGFTGEDIPRDLPPQIRSLSRVSPQRQISDNRLASNTIQDFSTGGRTSFPNSVNLQVHDSQLPTSQQQNAQRSSPQPTVIHRQALQRQLPRRPFLFRRVRQ